MYSRARRAASRSPGSAKESGSGTFWSSSITWPGLVPQETNGRSAVASMVTLLVKVAPSSVGSERQWSSAASQSLPLGAY